jgi:hypothetical protein
MMKAGFRVITPKLSTIHHYGNPIHHGDKKSAFPKKCEMFLFNDSL